MSSATSRPTVKAMDDQSEVSNLVFPPLMSTIDTYIDASSDLRYAQAVEKVDRTPAKKKGGGRKAAKKKQISHNLTPLEMDHHSSSRQPESLQAQSLDNLKEQYHLRRYSSSEREDYAFGSVSLESAPKGNGSGDPAAVRMAFVSSPPLTERRPAGSKNSFPPRSPARVIVQSPNVGAYAYSNVAHSSPTDTHSPGSNHHVGKTDLGFSKAVESLAAIKLHNYAMKRRENVTQKLKLLKEIRSLDRENNAELYEAQKMRRDEVLAAWKLRYYIEYLRMQTLKHVVDVVESKNQELEEECGLLQQTSAVAEIENESLTKEIARLMDALGATEAARGLLQSALEDTQARLDLTARQLRSTETDVVQTSELIGLSKQALGREQERVVALESELGITRQTCQDLVRACARKDAAVQDMSEEVQQLRAVHQVEQAEILLAREVHQQELENAKMREEDNEIRYRKANDLYAVLNDRERTIRHLETSVTEMEAQVVVLKEAAGVSEGALQRERESAKVLEQEKAGLQKLLSELARRLTQADEEAIKHSVIERQHKVDAKTAQGVINGHLATIEELEEQGVAAQNEIEFLVEENHELSREIECHHMYGEEMMTRYLHTFTAAERNQEYSRFLEEELFCARKLYEKTSSEYVEVEEGAARRGGGAGAGAGGEMFGDLSEESYGYHRGARASGAGAGAGVEEGEAGAGGAGAGERSRSFIESMTGLDPVAPMIVHLNSFSKGAPRSRSRSRNEFDRPNSASLYNPDSRPNSTGGANSSLMAEQRLLMVLAQLEDKMKSVDRAADSLRFLAEKADAIEKVQTTTANILNTHATAAAIARLPVRLSEQNAASARAAEEKQAHINSHIAMERVFSETHASLDRVNAQLGAQQAEIDQLQERKAECKNGLSAMKKVLKRSRKASTKDPDAQLLTEDQEGETESEVTRLLEEMEALKERITAVKSDNLELNSKSIGLQTELYHLDQQLERSAADFLQAYGEHIASYYPAELAHLVENADGQAEEHGQVNLPSPNRQLNTLNTLNTLYEEDEWNESVANGGEGSNESLNGGSLDTPGPGGSSLEESEPDAPYEYSVDNSPFTSKSKKHHRKASKMDSSDGGGESEKSKPGKSSKMAKLARKVAKMQKLAKKARQASALDAESTDGSLYDTGAALELEEGSSGQLEAGGSQDESSSLLTGQMQMQPERGVMFDTRTPFLLLTGTSGTMMSTGTAAFPGSPYHGHAHVHSPASAAGCARVGRVATGDGQVDRAARLQLQQARERLAHLRAQLEQSVAHLEAALDEVEVIETHRVGYRAEIVRWVDNFHSLCGYFPEPSDKQRSSTLKPSLDNFAAAQDHLQGVHARAEALYQECHALRAALIQEQHQQAAAIPLEQITEELVLLYPISEFGDLVLEDPLYVLTDAELQALAAAEADAAATSALQAVAAAAEGEVGVSQRYDESDESLDPELLQQMARALTVFGGEAAAAAALAKAKSSNQDKASQDQYTLQNPSTESEPESAQQVRVPATVSTSSEVHNEVTFQDIRDSASAAPTPAFPPQSHSHVAVTPFTTALAALAESDCGSIASWSEMSLKMTKSIKLDALFATRDETPEMLVAENKKLRKELRVWTSDYEKLYGHKPSPADFDSFDEIVKAKLFRKNQITVLLEVAVREGRIAPGALDGEVSTKTPSYGATATATATATAAEAKEDGEAGKPTTADSSYSVPATPYHTQLGTARPDLHSMPPEYSSSFQQTGHWAGMFADSAEETTAALVAEHARIKRDLRAFSQRFEAKHGHPPSPEFLPQFPAEIQEKIFRKGQLKQLLADRADAGAITSEVAWPKRGGNSRPSSAGNSNSTLKRGASMRPKSPSSKGTAAAASTAGSDTESSVGSPAVSRTKSPKRPASNPRSKLQHAQSTNKATTLSPEQTDSYNSDSVQSFPTTPYADREHHRYSDLDSALSLSTSDFTSRSTKSSKFAALFTDPLHEAPEVLLAEQREVKTALRRWAGAFVAQHGRKPEPHEYEDFDEEIKRLIFRKNQLKKHFAALSADAPAGAGAAESDIEGQVGRSSSSPRSAAAESQRTELTAPVPVSAANAPVAPAPVAPALVLAGTQRTAVQDATEEARTPARASIRVQDTALPAAGALLTPGTVAEAVDSFPSTSFGLGADQGLGVDHLDEGLERDEPSIEALLKEQAALRDDVIAWTAAYVKQHGAKPSADVFAQIEPEMQTKLLRKNLLEKLLAERGIGSAASAEDPESFESDSMVSTHRVEASTSASHSEPSAQSSVQPAVKPAVEPARKASTFSTGPSEGEAAVGAIPEEAGDSGAGAYADSPTRKVPSTGRKSRMSKVVSLTAAYAPVAAGVEADPDWVGTAMSIDSTYSVPTTPYAGRLRDSDGAADESIDDYGADMSVRLPAGVLEHQLATTALAASSNTDRVSVQAVQEELRQLKRDLRRWNASFVQLHGRNPDAVDFDAFPVDVKAMLLRKTQLKEQLNRALGDPGNVQLNEEEAVAAVGDASFVLPSNPSQSAVALMSATAAPSAAANTSASSEDAIEAIVRELSEVKHALKAFQKEFANRTGRDPKRADLPPAVLELGERHDALKQALIDCGRADLVSSASKSRHASFLQGVPVTASPAAPPASAAASAPVATADTASAVDDFAEPSDLIYPSRAAAAASGQRPSSPKNKRVSFLAHIHRNRDSDDDSRSATPAAPSAAITSPVQSRSPLQVASAPAPTSAVVESLHTGAASSITATTSATPTTLNPSLELMSGTELSAEYSRVKKALKQWQKDFQEQHGREPGDEDFDSLDEAFKDLVVRKYEIKALLGDRGDEAGASVSSKSAKKSKKSSKHSGKHVTADPEEEEVE